MISDAVKVERERTKQEMIRATRDVLNNPVVDVVAAWILIEYLQSHVDPGTGERVAGGGWMGSASGSVLQGGLGGYLVMQSADKMAPAIADFTKALAPIIPAVVK